MALDIARLAREVVPLPVSLPVASGRLAREVVAALPAAVDVGPQGFEIPFAWGRLAGVERAELPPTSLTIAPPSAGHADRGIPLGVLPSRVEGGELIVDVPPGRRIRALHIADLRTNEASPVALRGAADLGVRRLSVSAADRSGSFTSPIVAVPPVGRRHQVPPTLTGGSYEARVLALPDVAGVRLRISLVTGGSPDEFSPVAVTAGKVTGWAAPIPRDLQVTGPNGTVLWTFPGELLPGSATATVDLTVGLEGAIDALIAADAAVEGAVTITAKQPARIHVAVPAIRGAFLRTLRGTTAVELAGRAAVAPVAGAPLPTLEPTQVVGDVRVVYAGLRVAEISDLLPVGRAVAGVVVEDQAVLRALPPAALRQHRIARVGVIGRAACVADLTVQLVDLSVPERPALATASLAGLEPNPHGEIDVVWFELGAPVDVTGPIGVSLTATRGAFYWVADPEPRVQIAVADPDPGGRPILLDGRVLLTLDTEELAVRRAALPGAAFAGGAGSLVFASALYCKVELTDLELRYARPGAA